MTEVDPVLYHRRLLMTLRTLRNRAELTQEQVAQRLGWSVSKVIRVENGKNNITRDDLSTLLALYGVTSATELRDLVETARRARRPSWPRFKDAVSTEFRAYTGLERAASVIRSYEPLLIPGMLQTSEYAQAVITALSDSTNEPDVIARRIDILRERQRLLTARTGPRMHFLIDESAVRRRVGGRAVMAAQLRRLKELAALPTMTIQIVPFGVGEYASMTTPFIILEFPDGDEPLLYLEDARQDLLTRDDPEMTREYQRRFDEIAGLATPASRLDRVLDDLVGSVELVGVAG
jgi:transcriptional regulator with XRE-family HTH domain